METYNIMVKFSYERAAELMELLVSSFGEHVAVLQRGEKYESFTFSSDPNDLTDFFGNATKQVDSSLMFANVRCGRMDSYLVIMQALAKQRFAICSKNSLEASLAGEVKIKEEESEIEFLGERAKELTVPREPSLPVQEPTIHSTGQSSSLAEASEPDSFGLNAVNGQLSASSASMNDGEIGTSENKQLPVRRRRKSVAQKEEPTSSKKDSHEQEKKEANGHKNCTPKKIKTKAVKPKCHFCKRPTCNLRNHLLYSCLKTVQCYICEAVIPKTSKSAAVRALYSPFHCKDCEKKDD